MSRSLLPAKSRRSWTTFSLRTFLIISLVLSVTLGYFGRVWLKAYRDSQPPTLYELAQIAKRHGIPMPPKEAKLVLVKIDDSYGPSPATYAPAFLLPKRETAQFVLHGDQEFEISTATQNERLPAWREFSLTAPDSQILLYGDEPLLCAIQLAERGDDGPAKAIYEDWLKTLQAALDRGQDMSVTDATGKEHWLRSKVRRIACDRVLNELTHNRENWPELRKQLAGLLAESEPLHRQHGQFLADLAATVDAPAPLPGSVEAMLGDLVGREDDDEPVQQLSRRGFDPIPELIRLCEDRRLTGSPSSQSADDFERLGDLASAVLQQSSLFQWGADLSVEMPEDVTDFDAKFWANWWEQARRQGEREYYVRNFFSDFGNDLRARQTAADILAAKYPDTLRGLGDEYLKVGKFSPSRLEMAQAIRLLRLPRETLVEMLVNIARHGTPQERRSVLRELMFLDQERACKLLVQLFDELPADAKGLGSTFSSEPFPRVVLLVNDRELTAAYLRATRRNVSLRMELLSRLAFWYSDENERPGRLALLAKFLDDDTRIRTLNSERHFSDELWDITVRDFVAIHIAKLLEMEDKPSAFWTPDEWSTLRDQVRERLKQEKLPELE